MRDLMVGEFRRQARAAAGLPPIEPAECPRCGWFLPTGQNDGLTACQCKDILMTPLEIRAARLALGMNQREFAEALRVGGEAVIRSWESGRRPISGPATVAIELMLKAGK